MFLMCWQCQSSSFHTINFKFSVLSIFCAIGINNRKYCLLSNILTLDEVSPLKMQTELNPEMYNFWRLYMTPSDLTKQIKEPQTSYLFQHLRFPIFFYVRDICSKPRIYFSIPFPLFPLVSLIIYLFNWFMIIFALFTKPKF